MVIRKLFILFLVLFGVFVVPVSADENVSVNGTVTFSYSTSNTYNLENSLSRISATPTRIVHRFTDAKELRYLVAYDVFTKNGGVQYTINNYTSFTSIVDGTYYGSGIVGVIEYEPDTIRYDITFTDVDTDYADTLTGIQLIYLTFDTSILSDVTVYSSATVYYSNFDYNNVLTSLNPSALHSSSGTLVYTKGDYFTGWGSTFLNSYDYNYNNLTGLSNVVVDKGTSASKWNVYNYSGDSYFYETAYNLNDIGQTFVRGAQVHANISFDTGYDDFVLKILDLNGYTPPGNGEDGDDFEYNITTELDEYSPGDTVNVTYTTDQKGTIQVVKTISGDIYHSIGFVSGATNATWDFYIAENEPYGLYDVYLLDSSNTILDSVRYSLLPTTSSLDILQSSVDLHETFVVFAQTVNESILSIEDPDGVEVWNESIGALMYDYIYYTPTIKQGIYTAYLYDDATLNDTVMVYSADPPIIDDPLDPETNGSIVVEDVLGDDESMTEYFNGKFRDFAPTIWGFFMLMCLLFLMSILTSFNSGGKRR